MDILDELLTETMIGTAAESPEHYKQGQSFPIQEPNPTTSKSFSISLPPSMSVPPAPFAPAVPDIGSVQGAWAEVVAKNPIWRYENPTFEVDKVDGAQVIQVKGLKCKVSDMNYMRMDVADLIQWGPVQLSYEGQDIPLPLAQGYEIRRRFIHKGQIAPSSHGYWQLEAEVDQSFEIVFGYEIYKSAKALHINTLQPINIDLFYRNSSSHQGTATTTSEEFSYKITLTTPPVLTILVVVTLVTCKERADYQPGGVIAAGRFYPMILVLSSGALGSITGSVKIHRNLKTSMPEKWMTDEIKPIFMTDRNSDKRESWWDPGNWISAVSELPTKPYWDNIFSYYKVEFKQEEYNTPEYTMVEPFSKKRVIEKAVTVDSHWSLDPENPTTPQDVIKLAGQGEFDNVHFAPRMKVLANGLPYASYSSQPERKRISEATLDTLDEVLMAPFCVHDCLHMHWRWASGPTDKSVMGWDGDEPFKQAGLPLVPGNQRVTLKLLSPIEGMGPGCTYKAVAAPVSDSTSRARTNALKSLNWQIFLHHGLAYALSSPLKSEIEETWQGFLATDSLPGADIDWPLFYWYLRYYCDDDGILHERLSFSEEKLEELRKA